MIYVQINDILKKQGKSKYWLIKNMECGYQSMSKLMNNETISIRFSTLEKICDVLECSPGDILCKKNK